MDKVTVLVTGATGFVGTHLIPMLDNFEYKIVVREFSEYYPREKQIIYNKKNLEKFCLDINKFNASIVVHLASYLTSLDDFECIDKVVDSNILFTSNLLKSLSKTDLKLFINTGSFSEFYLNDEIEDPAYFYAASKIAAKPILKYFQNLLKFKLIHVIPYTIYGGESKSMKVIDYLLDSTKSDVLVDMTDGNQILDFIHIEDVVNFYLTCLDSYDLFKYHENYFLGTGVGTSIKELASIIESETHLSTNINWGKREYRPLDIMKAVAPVSKNSTQLAWKAKISIQQGIGLMLNSENI
ncbi:NAD(P)-dependent oxidoreductase [Opitutales bacterium]|nr:NAD(P)-dependent oxidoreductase [Opitutales bacterium]